MLAAGVEVGAWLRGVDVGVPVGSNVGSLTCTMVINKNNNSNMRR